MNAKRFTTRGIVLARTNFGEADRILTFLTPDHGKLRAIAKGSRKQKSKLAAGIEPFSVTDLTVLAGKGEVNTLMSSRLVKHFGNISSDLGRLNGASAAIRLLHINTEDSPETAYYNILVRAFQGYNNKDLPPLVVEFWYEIHFLKLTGHTANLQTDISGQKLEASQKYNFDFDKMSFFAARAGKYDANHIKFLRLCTGLNKAEAITRITGWENLIKPLAPLVQSMLKTQLRV